MQEERKLREAKQEEQDKVKQNVGISLPILPTDRDLA